MKTINEIKAEIGEEINKVLIGKGYDTTEPIDLNPDDVFSQRVSDHFVEPNADYHFQIEVFIIKSDKDDIKITGTYDENTIVRRRMNGLTVEQLFELYESVQKLPDYEGED